MPTLRSLALLTILQLSTAAPAPQSSKFGKRDFDQNPKTIDACTDKGCAEENCPMAFWVGTGWPECRAYETSELDGYGFEVTDNGQTEIFFDIPPQDPGCSVIVQTPVVSTEGKCGGNVLVAPDATCAPIKVDSNFMIMFCCGVDDCGAAGAPPLMRRTPNPASGFGGGSSGALILYDRSGNVIEPKLVQPKPVLEPKPVIDDHAAESKLEKRCEEFTATSAPYTAPGAQQIISDIVTCPPTQECQATESKSVTESFSVGASVSVSDPLGIVSASVSVNWEESTTTDFSSTYTFGAGERGYVLFIPILTCVDGYFCDGEVTTVCGPTKTGGSMTGDRRGVIIRG
ncbi:hypothetical protein Q7P37_006694 [Cladosporium fusiforme]